jgi:hypothetical protein
MICDACGTTGLKETAKYCFHCGHQCTKKCRECEFVMKQNDNFCSDCGVEVVKSIAIDITSPPPKKPKLVQKTDLSSARMFHPHNGRQDFNQYASCDHNGTLMNAKIYPCSALFQKEIKQWIMDHPDSSASQRQEEFGLI